MRGPLPTDCSRWISATSFDHALRWSSDGGRAGSERSWPRHSARWLPAADDVRIPVNRGYKSGVDDNGKTVPSNLLVLSTGGYDADCSAAVRSAAQYLALDGGVRGIRRHQGLPAASLINMPAPIGMFPSSFLFPFSRDVSCRVPPYASRAKSGPDRGGLDFSASLV